MRYIPVICSLIWVFLPPSVLAAEAPAARVVVVTVTDQRINETTRLLGIIDFDRVSRVSGEIPGSITEQHAVEGTQIKAGDPLVELNTDFTHKDIEIKQKQRDQVSADLQKVGASLKRLENLLQKNSASRQTYDDALYDHRSLQKKRESLDLELQRLRIELQKSTIRAPFDGIVLEKLKERGEWMDRGAAVAVVASTGDVIASIALSEQLIRFQEPGAPVPVTISSLDLQLEGKVLGIKPVATLRSKSATLKVGIPFKPGMVRNMSASVEILSSEAQRLLIIPRDALISKKGGGFVYTVEKGKASLVPVDILARRGDTAGVAPAPLKQGMLVVVDGNDRLQPGQAVQIVE